MQFKMIAKRNGMKRIITVDADSKVKAIKKFERYYPGLQIVEIDYPASYWNYQTSNQKRKRGYLKGNLSQQNSSKIGVYLLIIPILILLIIGLYWSIQSILQTTNHIAANSTSASAFHHISNSTSKTIETTHLDDSNVSKLREYIFTNNVTQLETLFQDGLNPNIMCDKTNTCFMLATYTGNVEVVQLFLSYGTNPNLIQEDQTTPLYTSILSGDKEMVNLLLENGANPNLTSNHNLSPYMFALELGKTGIAESIKRAGGL
ncbi:ankyrin repeat domain-containing protein [Ornithinibacillus halotolerans]|uniref:Ankyrin repeat domain-containing protein n=1 Tax=Ornithinibacillus halotolerans TaxID=1274357 RepID=A0A916S121_9BACI|nr:ankyrin repeat domain-containing protein [Ornithinibacillus halotolerans]GGA78864.1 hypothetical protein GCM10008025_22920 [Ornithinibacillus halotolerans]